MATKATKKTGTRTKPYTAQELIVELSKCEPDANIFVTAKTDGVAQLIIVEQSQGRVELVGGTP